MILNGVSSENIERVSDGFSRLDVFTRVLTAPTNVAPLKRAFLGHPVRMARAREWVRQRVERSREDSAIFDHERAC